MLEAAGTYAVRALLIFLHLLKRDAKSIGQGGLAHTQHRPLQANASANIDIDVIRFLLFYQFVSPSRVILGALDSYHVDRCSLGS